MAGHVTRAGAATASRSATPDLKSHVLSQRVVPRGFKAIDESAKDNRAAAMEGAALVDRSDDWLKRLESWGRTGGYSITYQRQTPNAVEMLASEVESFNTPEGATSSLRMSRKLVESKATLEKALKSFGIRISKMEIRKSPVGEPDSVMLLVKGTATGGERPVPAEVVQIIWRKDRTVNNVAWIVLGLSKVSEPEVVRLAEVQDKLGN